MIGKPNLAVQKTSVGSGQRFVSLDSSSSFREADIKLIEELRELIAGFPDFCRQVLVPLDDNGFVDWVDLERTYVVSMLPRQCAFLSELLNNFSKFSLDRAIVSLREKLREEEKPFARIEVIQFLNVVDTPKEIAEIVKVVLNRDPILIDTFTFRKLREKFPEILTDDFLAEIEAGVTL